MSMGVTVENSGGVIHVHCHLLFALPQVYTKKAIYMALSAVLAKYLQKTKPEQAKNIVI